MEIEKFDSIPEKILVVGPSWVGDMVMSQALYIILKHQNPKVEIDVLAPAWCKPILERMPEVSRAIDMPLGHGDFALSTRWDLGKMLRATQYSKAFILPNSAKSALIPWFAKIPKRIGWKGEFRYGLLNDLRPDKRVFQYMVERYAALAHDKDNMINNTALAMIPKPRLSVDSINRDACISRFGIDANRKTIGICPGAEFGPAKRWPERHYATIVEHFVSKGAQVCLFGGPKDTLISKNIINLIEPNTKEHCFDLSGKTSLVDVIDLLSSCETVFSNDSGLMHVAAAVGCNILGIYGSSSPNYTPPLTDRAAIVNTDISCRPCFKRTCPLGHMKCLTELSPQLVLEKYENLKISVSH
ncbi:ADP-heptose--LPS heptosyltransferase [Grimontia sp. AD028]|uniref:lipopolysaccharide heptosyltransferase II n=1 Tax=Grimontia sp. AD028 TaxID=1581149 RepID=UPI00061B1657|nr:lipopolysaccharide heptosyltransferase II [Grimontia sp. AD028]KKD61489.1 ADP-heptose--LPS heptosyltransferase [Grimontia sp. AD028]